jgi:hypothetical protein
VVGVSLYCYTKIDPSTIIGGRCSSSYLSRVSYLNLKSEDYPYADGSPYRLEWIVQPPDLNVLLMRDDLNLF